MPTSKRLENFFSQAEAKEKACDWLEAARLYEQALNEASKEDSLRKGEITERVGECFHRAALQGESQEEFRERIKRAVESYKRAMDFYAKSTDKCKAGRMSRCASAAAYLNHYLVADPSKKRELLDECLDLEAEALQTFLGFGDMLEYGRTYGELPLVFWERAILEWSGQAVERIFRRGMEWGETAVGALSEADALHELANSHFTLSVCLANVTAFISEIAEQKRILLEAVEHMRRAIDLFKRADNSLFSGMSNLWLAHILPDSPEQSRKNAEEALDCGERTRDKRLIAGSLGYMIDMTHLEALAEEDPEKWKSLMEEVLRLYERAYPIHSRVPLPSPGISIGSHFGYMVYYYAIAERESVIEKKLDLLQRAEERGGEALKLAEFHDRPFGVSMTLAYLAGVHEERAKIHPSLTEKKRRLETAVKFKERVYEIREQTQPFNFWGRGVALTTLAKHRMELADIEPDVKAKERLLEEALSNMETGLKLLNKELPFHEKEPLVSFVLRRDQDFYAALLTRLWDLVKEPEYLRRAIDASREAIYSAEKLGQQNLIAESYWSIAKAQDMLGEHLESAESFRQSSENYRKSAEQIPPLKALCQEYASYMEAWSEIEKAKHRHAEKQHGLAREHYEKAAELHTATERWKYLAPNYSALAHLEHAEDLSRVGQSEESHEAFQQAANLLSEAKKSFEEKPEIPETNEEEQTAAELAEALDARLRYCRGRVAIEEARMLDRQGDHAGSSRKYALAFEKFQELIDAAKTEPERMELRPILLLSQAWHAMTRAEAEASPNLYMEASRLFDEAKNCSADETGRVLALGHSSFCRALEAGTRFEATGDVEVYSTAKKNLEAAARYYLKAGFNDGSKYAKATHRLFDTYLYTNKADMETDPEKKTQLYHMAEKLLQTSAGLYMEAKHPEKCKQVQRLLESIKEERQMAESLSQVLHVPTTTSTTTSFSMPTQTREIAIGLERFEHADIQANLVFRMKETKVGEDIEFRIEMVNAGKTPALLVKVDEAVPQGFELKEVPETYTVEDSCINMKGRRLNPLKTEDIKVVVTPQATGTFVMKPRILYLDETGKYKSHEPEPVTIAVKELGITGWIKGKK